MRGKPFNPLLIVTLAYKTPIGRQPQFIAILDFQIGPKSGIMNPAIVILIPFFSIAVATPSSEWFTTPVETTSTIRPGDGDEDYDAPSIPTFEWPLFAETAATKSMFSIWDTVSTQNADPRIQNVCEKCNNREVCISAVEQGIALTGRKPENIDVTEVLVLQMEAGRRQTEQAWIQYRDIYVKDAEKSMMVKVVMDSCMRNYNDSMDGYEDALDAVKRKDMGDLQTQLSATAQGYDDCGDDEAPEDPVPPADGPWVKYNQDLLMLVDNCFELAKLLKSKWPKP
ncbi:Pectinesterase [Zostera marina]|uniref:Pectinesterase n=1 Tax=Zostera marina TaxID=29655 RepID=A0A0K9PNF9_ZOSMR|nr:Pectinesterase [Zostera marina]